MEKWLHFLAVSLLDVNLDALTAGLGIMHAVHCAGCFDYFDTAELKRVNIGLTQMLLERCKSWRIERFIYVSTAFSSGYVEETVTETLHSGPADDPTEYIRTKRHAEGPVSTSGLPFLYLRPSIVIGDSRDRLYTGNRYGLYQLWSGIERLHCTRWEPEYHLVASDEPVHFIHQDGFQAAFRSLDADCFLTFSPTRRWPRTVKTSGACGHDVLAYDFNGHPSKRLVQQGGRQAGSVAEIGRSCQKIMVLVVDGERVERVVYARGGLLETIKDGVIFIHSTIALPELHRIALTAETNSNVTIIDCPVSGGVKDADEGRLAMLCVGDKGAFEAKRSLLDAVAANVTHLGPLGAGMIVRHNIKFDTI